MAHSAIPASIGHGRSLERSAGPDMSTVTVPWLDGELLGYLIGDKVLDIKIPGERDRGPVVPNAAVVSLAAFDAASDLSEALGPDVAASYDAVFSRDGLSAANDPPVVLARLLDLLRPGGYLVLVAFQNGRSPEAQRAATANEQSGLKVATSSAAPLAEAALVTLPQAMSRPVINPASFRRMVEASLQAGSFVVVHTATTPARHLGSDNDEGANYTLVLRKLARSEPARTPEPAILQPPPIMRAVADVSIPFMHIHPHRLKTPGMRHEDGILVRDFAPDPPVTSRILILKLDHHGDFIIGMPALRELREAFPNAYIRLVCGSWNVNSVRASKLVDDVCSFDYFPERAAEWTGIPNDVDWKTFASAVEGYYDLAVDLRVDEDTRSLLGRIDAGVRCGIGTQAKFPMLDIALPDGSRAPGVLPLSSQGEFSLMPEGSQVLTPDAFESAMQVKTASFHESGFRSPKQELARSGAFLLPEGVFDAEFHLSIQRFLPGPSPVGLTIEVLRENDTEVARKTFGRRTLAKLSPSVATLRFKSDAKPTAYEFRIGTQGKPLFGRIRFAGMRLRRLDANGARFSPSELHVGEKLSLLVSLIRQRTRALPAELTGAVQDDRTKTPALRSRKIVIAPFSNSTIRDWPMNYYATLVKHLVETYDCRVELVGSPKQVRQAAELVSLIEADDLSSKVDNRVGQTTWGDIPAILRSADLVVCNNSGIGHQAAELGARVLAIYSASHQPLEWGPRGLRSRAVMASVACSPCGYERIGDCVNDHLCMRLLTPELVAKQIAEIW